MKPHFLIIGILYCTADAVCAASDVPTRQYPLEVMPIIDRVKVPVGPGWLETGFGSLWVSKSNSRQVLRIDPHTDRVIATIPVGSDPELGIAVGLGFVWIADPHDHSITQIDPRTNEVVRVLAANVSADPEGSIGVGANSLWVLTDTSGTDSGTLTRIDATSGRVTADIRVKPRSHAALVAFDSVWVTSTGSASLTRVDPRSNTVAVEIPLPAKPRFLIAGADAIWIWCQGEGVLVRVDPVANRVIARIAIGAPGDGGDLSVGEGFVWVSAEGVPLSQVDSTHNVLLRQFVGGKKDDTLRVGFGAAWVLDELNGEIWKVDLRKVADVPILR